ncbi:MAG TPA: chloride channel protein [Chthoniobacterales bacterium]
MQRPGNALADFTVNPRVFFISALAFVVGLFASFIAVALIWLINLVTNVAFFGRFSAEASSPANSHLGLSLILVPVAGSLIIGLMARYGSEKIRGHGIPEALEAILLGRSRLDAKVAVLKPLSSAISIGTGGPFGAEGPIIMTGGAFGSLFAQLFELSANERKTLLVAGAAAGMSAIFGTPLAAIMLALELLLFEWKPRSLVPVAIASITAGIARYFLLGAPPIFPVIHHPVLSPSTLWLAAVVGLAVGFASAGLTVLVYFFEDRFSQLRIHWMWWPALGGLVVGVGGLIEPRVLGVGYDTIHALLNGAVSSPDLVKIAVLKALVWAVALGSGTSGGVLAPLLMMGGAVGTLLAPWLAPHDLPLCALLGMASMMAGTMRTPFTAIFFAVELTHDFQCMPHLLVGSISALFVTVLLMRRSILTEKIARRGHHVSREYSVDLFQLLRVKEVMAKEPPSAPASMTVAELADRIAEDVAPYAQRHGVPLVDEQGRLAGMITRADIMRALRNGKGEDTLLNAGSRDLIVTSPDELLSEAAAKMLSARIGRLPVVDPTDPTKLVGYLGRGEFISGFEKSHQEEHHRERSSLLQKAVKLALGRKVANKVGAEE